MLLRRFIEHLHAQNWVAVGLDLFIVILGVFLGFQLTAWNQGRQDRALEQEYLERLHADMVGSIENYNIPARWDAQRLDTQAIVLDALRSGAWTEKNRADFDHGLTFAGVHNPLVRRWGTVEELKSTGNIALIRDLHLRNQIAETEANYERVDRIYATLQDEITQLRARMVENIDPVGYGFTPDDPAMADYDFEALAADKRFINLFAHVNLKSGTIVFFHERHMRRIEALRDALAEILGVDAEQDG
jgi:hypothetical protein